MSAFSLYALGYIALMAGVGYGAYLLHAPQTWIGVGLLVMLGLGIMSAVSRTKVRDAPKEAPPTEPPAPVG
ncbi:MAG: hypothetical protein ABUS48_01230 [Pseudomonadota bacterium]